MGLSSLFSCFVFGIRLCPPSFLDVSLSLVSMTLALSWPLPPLITFIFRLATRRCWVSPEDQPPGCLPRTPVVRIQAHVHTKPPFHQAEPSLTSDRESPPGGPAGVCALEFSSVVVVYTKRITACTPLSPRLGSALLGRTFCCSLRLCPFFHVSE